MSSSLPVVHSSFRPRYESNTRNFVASALATVVIRATAEVGHHHPDVMAGTGLTGGRWPRPGHWSGCSTSRSSRTPSISRSSIWVQAPPQATAPQHVVAPGGTVEGQVALSPSRVDPSTLDPSTLDPSPLVPSTLASMPGVAASPASTGCITSEADASTKTTSGTPQPHTPVARSASLVGLIHCSGNIASPVCHASSWPAPS